MPQAIELMLVVGKVKLSVNIKVCNFDSLWQKCPKLRFWRKFREKCWKTGQ